VRSYFTAAEKRARIGEMVDLAQRVRVIETATALEASVRELRLIAEHKPSYNRRSRSPERQPWLRLTSEAHPRLSIVRSVPAGTAAIGPFPSHAAARSAQEAIVAAVPLRTCTTRLPLLPAAGARACVQAEIGRCVAPCTRPEADYGPIAARASEVLQGRVDVVVAAAHRTIAALSAQQRYEEAAECRDRLAAFLRGAARTERLRPLQEAAEVVAARRPAGPGSGWEILVMRYGRMVGSAVSRPGADPRVLIESLRSSAAAVDRPTHAGGAASAAETELLYQWLCAQGVRLVHWSSGDGEEPGWSMPRRGASAYLEDLGAAAFRDPRMIEHHVLGPGGADPAAREPTAAGMMDPTPTGSPLEETC